MTSEKALEVRRQLFHLVLGSVIAIAVWILKPIIGNMILIPLIVALTLLFLVPRIAPKSMVSNQLLNHFERKKDVKTFPYKGAIFYGIGIFFPLVMLQTELACVVIIILSVGDAFSTLIGKFLGKHRIGNKTLEGTLAFVLFSFLGGLIFLNFSGHLDLVKPALGLTIAGALVEMQEKVDDNLAVPLCLSIIAKIAGL